MLATQTAARDQRPIDSLSRAVSFGNAYREGQEDQLSARGRVVNAIVVGNTNYLEAELLHLRRAGRTIADDDLERLSLLGSDTSIGSAATSSPFPTACGMESYEISGA